ncbi:MAG: DNA transformation protein [Pseudoalteromonas tetraodonis]|jgi:DNA transformation protein
MEEFLTNCCYPEPPKRLRDLNGFGPRSEEILAELGIDSVENFIAIDPYDLYAMLKPIKGMGLNSIYAIIGARENISWLEIAKTRKIEILIRLDDLGLAPK